MKKITLIAVVLLGFVWQGWGQERNITGNYYVTIVDIPVIEHDLITANSKTDTLIAKKGTKFTVIEVSVDKVILKFWKFKGEKQLTDDKSNEVIFKEEPDIHVDKRANGKYYEMKISDFDAKTRSYYGKLNSFTWGFTIVPIKLRFGSDNRDFEYSEGFSLGVNAGYEYSFAGVKAQSISFLGGVAISTVSIDHKTTNGYLDLGETRVVGAFTPSIGIVYTYEKFQVGVFSGIDFIGGELGNSWVHKNRPWLGVGLGFTIFQKSKTSDSETQEQSEIK